MFQINQNYPSQSYIMMEHQEKQKNMNGVFHRTSVPTLKIKNITFSREYTKTIDQELLNFHLRMGKNMGHRYLDFKGKNKENLFENVHLCKNNQKKTIVSDIFSIKAVNAMSLSKLFLPNKALRDSINSKIPQFSQKAHNRSSSFLKKRSNSKQIRLTKKAKTNGIQQFERQNCSQGKFIKFRPSSEKTQARDFIQKERRLVLNTNDKIFQTKFQSYCNFLLSVANVHGLSIDFKDYQKLNTFWVGRGNNAKLVKDTLKKRWWLKPEQKKINQPVNFNQINFVWTQTKINEFYWTGLTQGPSLHNHFEYNGNLGNKKQLFLNMKSYYQDQGKNPFETLPLTFHIKSVSDQSYRQFLQFNETQKQKNNKKCLWILKPGQNSNRGRGITIHTEVQQIQKIIKQQNTSTQQFQQNDDSHTFILQKYIQRPFLYQKRKFDLRCYYLLVNLNDSIKGYWYKDGYIRTSCFEFSTNQQSQSNFYVHLTNDAVQKHSENYGKYQDGNKIDYNTFKKYLASKNLYKKHDFDTQIYQKMKEIALDSIKSTYLKLKRYNKQMFEVFGLDFMIDEDFKPWLIEVNTNPCLETTCLVLQRIIPKMLDDAFQLSVDVMFPPPITWVSSRKHLIPNFQHSGFELIFDQRK